MKSGLTRNETHETPETAQDDLYIFTSYLWEAEYDPERPTSSGRHICLPFHRDRLIVSAESLGWSDALRVLRGPAEFKYFLVKIEARIDAQDSPDVRYRKVKAGLNKKTEFFIETTPLVFDPGSLTLQPSSLGEIEAANRRPCMLKLDTEAIVPSIHTKHKTSERSQYDRARKIAGISHISPNVAEVMLFNPDNEIMECSMSTPYFWRASSWVTPPLSSGGNAGVTRRIALESGLCKEEIVKVENLQHGEKICVSNGVRGFNPAILQLRD